MAGYRRFIAYVYEYPQGKKGMGKGFIRVEARGGVCRMRYKLAGSSREEDGKARIYGYVRTKDACLGIPLGNCDLTGDLAEFEQEFQEEDLNGSGYSLADLCGVILLTEYGRMYGSGWDDVPLDMEEMKLPENEKEEGEIRRDVGSEHTDTSEKVSAEDISSDKGYGAGANRSEPKDLPAQEGLSGTESKEGGSQQEEEKKSRTEDGKDGFGHFGYEEKGTEPEYKIENPSDAGKETEPSEAFQIKAGQDKELEQGEKPTKSREEKEEDEKVIQDPPAPDGWKEEWSRPVRRQKEPLEDRNTSSTKTGGDTGEKAMQTGMKSQSAAPKMQELTPFTDGEVEKCRRILPSDLKALACRDQGLMNNNFLRRGACRYGHLLLGRRKKDRQYILGVPGVYDPQERLMANMCGFPYFKEACGKGGHLGRFGYWYRLIDPPNLNRFYGF